MRVSGAGKWRAAVRRSRAPLWVAVLIVASDASGQARADTLNGALATAYTRNPELQAARASLRATDESVPQARAGYRPTIVGQGFVGYDNQELTVRNPVRADRRLRPDRDPLTRLPRPDDDPRGRLSRSDRDLIARLPRRFEIDGDESPHGYSITLNQPLFRGFQTINTVREAEANVLAARENLRSTEQSTLLNGVTAYMTVIQDRAIVRLQEGNLRVLSDELASNERRLKAGAVTKTDVAQSRAQRAASAAAVEGAKAQLQSSRANYEEVIGLPPRHLQTPGSIAQLLPRTLREAIEIAQSENPTVVAALFQEVAARNAVAAAKGQMLPQLDLQLTHQREFDANRLFEKEGETSVMATLKVPLYQAGSVSSQVRQAKQILFQRQKQVRQARLQVRTAVISAWSQLTSARAQLRSNRVSAEANKIALAGTRREEERGQRTVLDVLNAQQALLGSQVQMVEDNASVVIASYTLLSAIGRLTALYLRLPVELYDAEAYYRFVRRKLWGTRVAPRAVRSGPNGAGASR